MILRLLPLLSLLLPSTLATPSQRPNLGNWGVQDLEYPCYDPDRTCYLNFKLVQDTADNEPTDCAFTLEYPKEQAFTGVCGADRRYFVQAVWTSITSKNLGSLLVLVVFDTKLNAFATFNVYPNMLATFGQNSADQFQMAHYIDPDSGPTAGTTPTTLVAMGMRGRVNAQVTVNPIPDIILRRDDKDMNPMWQILRLHRLKRPDEKAVYLVFTINSLTGPLADCILKVTDADGTGSWFRQACSEFMISWGYNRDNDGAVMTVCNAKTGQDAFFGFDNVNGPQIAYVDSKWEPAGKSGCR